MNATSKRTATGKMAVNTSDLMDMLSCGRATAQEIGMRAGARVQIGKRVLWNTEKVRKYLDAISETVEV